MLGGGKDFQFGQCARCRHNILHQEDLFFIKTRKKVNFVPSEYLLVSTDPRASMTAALV